MSQVLTPDGHLQETLELTDSQAGFAGKTGEILTIEPAGAWRLARFLNQQVDQPHRQGQLTQESLRRLATLMASKDFFTLPDALGDEVPVNPHLITLAFGPKTSTLSRPGGLPLIAEPSTDRELASIRFIDIVKGLKALIGETQEN